MADYNIYIHSYAQYDSPTTPFQLRAESDTSGVGGESGGAGGSGFGSVRRAASFFNFAGSMVESVMSTPIGAAAAFGAVGVALIEGSFKIVDKVMGVYNKYIVPNTGKYTQSIEWANIKNAFHSFTHPVESYLASIQAQQEIYRNNAKNEQIQMLFGGTIYTSPYGRTL